MQFEDVHTQLWEKTNSMMENLMTRSITTRNRGWFIAFIVAFKLEVVLPPVTMARRYLSATEELSETKIADAEAHN
jgi:hypothetical protein